LDKEVKMAFEFLGKLAAGIQSNPEQFAVVADTIGSALDPENPFAGAGRALGQSGIAAKAAKEQRGQLDELIKTLTGILGSSDNPIRGASLTGSGENQGLKLDMDLGGIVGQGQRSAASQLTGTDLTKNLLTI